MSLELTHTLRKYLEGIPTENLRDAVKATQEIMVAERMGGVGRPIRAEANNRRVLILMNSRLIEAKQIYLDYEMYMEK